MKTINLTKKIFAFAAVFAIMSVSLVSCKDDEPGFVPANANGGLSDVYMAQSNAVGRVQALKVRGYGFRDSDIVTFIAEDGTEYPAQTVGVEEDGISVIVPPEMRNGVYVGRVDRENGSTLMLGHTQIYWVLEQEVEDRAGMTIKGTVSCDGKGIADVVVSDGYELTRTDAYGRYWLPSEKKNGLVFISLPSGYFPGEKTGMPGIFRQLSEAAGTPEQQDFALIEEPNDEHVLMLIADAHLANRGSGSNNDMDQFRNNFVPDINATIAQYKAEGKKVYGITLGDLTWDTYWYEKNYKLKEALADFAKINVPIFHTIGNHDNDIRCITDFETSEEWRRTVGPNYYSFNLGKVHYLVVDDIEYTTDGAEHKVEGVGFSDDVLAWMKKDLATVTDKSTPIVVCMHIPLHGHPGRSESGELITKYQGHNPNEFLALFDGFSKVRILSGHTHVNFNIPVNDAITEHVIGGACATWWWTGKYHNTHICRDGSVGGYGVMEWTGKDYKRYWKSMGYPRDYQFRTYDRNNVWITAEQYAPAQDHSDPTFQSNYAYLAQDYAWQHTNNEVIINVFSWEDSWKLEVTENGQPLATHVTNWFDPLHIINFDMFRLNKENDRLEGSAMKTAATSHFFRCYASSPTSTLEIKVTDCYGNVYRQTMLRPKAFEFAMQ